MSVNVNQGPAVPLSSRQNWYKAAIWRWKWAVNDTAKRPSYMITLPLRYNDID